MSFIRVLPMWFLVVVKDINILGRTTMDGRETTNLTVLERRAIGTKLFHVSYL
jgi:hypothetical protein